MAYFKAEQNKHKHKKYPHPRGGGIGEQTERLEVVRHAKSWHRNHFITVGLEVCQAKIRSLHHKAAILDANVKAGAQLIRHAAAEQCADIRILLGIQQVCPGVSNRSEDHPTHTGLGKRVEAFEAS